MLHNPNWERRSRVSQILSEAADLIEKHGHVKGRLGDRDEGMCANGAIYAAVDFNVSELIMATDMLADNLGLRLSTYEPGSSCVANWNNQPERTAREVIDALRAAAFVNEKQQAEMQ